VNEASNLRAQCATLGAMLALCSAAAAPTAEVSSQAAHMIVLEYRPELVAAGFPNPVRRLTINGKSAWFIFDTGAGVHTLAAWFVKEAGLVAASGAASGRDSTGREVRFGIVRHVVATADGGGALELPWASVADFPGLFKDYDLGGLLSPQLLASDGLAAVLDLRTPDLRFEPFAAAVSRLGAQQPSRGRARVCESKSDHPNRLYAVPVQAAGTLALLELDSGATTTLVRKTSKAGRALARGAVTGDRAIGVGGVAERTLLARGATLEFAGQVWNLDLTVGGASGQCSPDGLLGMDILRACAVILGQHETAYVCDRPPEHR
jgi:hypothetical protein